MSDILLRGGLVIDGSGALPYSADVAVSAGRIEAVGDLKGEDAALSLPAEGLIVSPGFIDCHSHADGALLDDPLAAPKVAQGVTTEVVGNCGFGPFPVRSSAAREAVLGAGLEGSRWAFASVTEYREALRERGTALNVAALVPHGAVRTSVMGMADRPAEEGELQAMCDLVQEGLEEGAAGVSLGLLYPPGCFTPKEEIVALGRVTANHTRPLVFHVRNEGDLFEDSIQEAIAIGLESSADIHISHLKVADPANWGRVGAALTRLDEAGRRGQRVTCDQYPYTAGSSPFTTLLPPWALEGGVAETLSRLRQRAARVRIEKALAGHEQIPGWPNLSLRIGWDRTVVGSAPGAEHWEGRSLAEIAREGGRSTEEVLFELLLVTKGSAIGIWHQMCEEDVRSVMQHPAQMTGSDGLHTPGKPHPRLWGTFPRVLGHYVRELGLLGLEQAVHKMTGKTASTFRLPQRGLIRPGYHADICVFDAERIIDRATYEDPIRPPDGIVHVICNGVPTLLEGRRTDHRPGAWVG